MKKSISYLSWPLLLIALVAWCAVVWFALTISTQEADRTSNVQSAQDSSAKKASAARIHGLAQDTAQERAQLANVLNVDVVSVVAMIRAVGKAAGVNAKLSDALPETAPATAPGAPAIEAVGFVVQADGSFSALMHAAQLYETLPVPSSLQRLDIQAVPNLTAGKTPTWHMSLYLRVLVNATNSS